MKNKLSLNPLLLIFASVTAFIFVPLFMIGNSPEDYGFIDVEIFFKSSIVYVIVYGLLLNILNVIFSILKLQKVATFYSYFVFSWIVISGFILPLSTSTGMVEPSENPVDFLNLFFVLLISIIFAIASLTAIKKYILIFLVVLIVSSLVQSLNTIHNSEIYNSYIAKNHAGTNKNLDNIESLLLSKKKNIFVISFDGVPGDIVTNIIKENKKYYDELKDFIVFENAVSQSPATAASLLGDIYGIQDYQSKGITVVAVKKTLEKEGLNEEILAKHVPDSFQYGYIRFQIKPIPVSVFTLKDKISTFEFYKYPIARMGTRIGVKINNYLSLEDYMLKVISLSGLQIKLRNHKGASWDKPKILELNTFDSFVSSISTSKKDFSLRYMHFTFTHFPVDFDSECSYRSHDKAWYKRNQNSKGIKGEATCAVRKFIEFTHKLKELGIYDNSLIVFKSDHGKPTYYFDDSPNNLKINGHKRMGYSRYRPTLMIKDFREDKAKIIFKSELVLLPDIAKTLCENSGLKISCEKFKGVNLLDDSLKKNEPYYIYVVKNKNSRFNYSTHKSIKIPSRNISLRQAMEESEFIDLSWD